MNGFALSHLLALLWLFGNANSSLYTIIKAGWNVHGVKDFKDQPAKKLGLMKRHLMAIDEMTALTKAESAQKYAALLGVKELYALNIHLFIINIHYRQLKQYVTTDQNLAVDFAKDIIVNNRSDSVFEQTRKLRTFFSNPERRLGSFLSDVGMELKNLDQSVCVLENSPKEVLAQLSSIFALGLIKGYILMQFSYALLSEKDNGKYYERQGKYRDEFRMWLYEVLAGSKEVIQNASGDLWRCDPKAHVEGETYEQFTKFMQGFIQHETFLNKDHSCAGTCDRFNSTEVYVRCDKKIDDFSEPQKCEGNVFNCENLDDRVTICTNNTSTIRRYDFLKHKNGTIQGHKKRCSGPEYDLSSWLALTIIGYECSYCFCFCDEETQSDRFVSMRSSLSDIRHNRVVTGMRFVKNNGLIKIQVQEGKLMKYGLIDRKTVSWVPVDSFFVHSPGVCLKQDYYKLTLETNLLYLDDVYADEGHVVTGVRFKMLGSGLLLEILISPYNFFTGRLIDPYGRSFWKDNIAVVENRRQIQLEAPDIPILHGPRHKYVKRSNEAVRFRSTDVDKDLAQTTVPFFDAQRLFSETPVPLSGVGIIHKGREGSGGFIAPKIITRDYSRYLPEKRVNKQPRRSVRSRRRKVGGQTNKTN